MADEPSDGARAILIEDQRVPLRLTATRGTLGLELYEPVELGALTVLGLAVSLPGLKFPLDLSGGVPKFRHRRGQLEQVRIAVELERLVRWVGPRLRELLDEPVRAPALWCLPHGVGVGIVGRRQALAFDVLWAPDHANARWVVANARGAGLGVPAIGLALRALDTALGGSFERKGRVLRAARVGERIARLLLPAVGARAPAAGSVRFSRFNTTESRVEATLDSGEPPHEIALDAARALELAQLVTAADDELTRGDSERARSGYVAALERAPRHPELVRTIAEIDARIDGRTEAALGLLVETLPATHAGLIGAELLARIGDLAGARQAVTLAVASELFAPLAALTWLRWAELEPEAPERFAALDRAVAQSQALFAPRWTRFVARVGRGDLEGALADAEHLEAAERGARARHAVCKDAGRVLLDGGFVREAGRVFERALRYLPDDAAATAGLARALILAGRPRRALSLLERAVSLTEGAGAPDADALIDLAKILAEHSGDFPQAIARVRQISASSPRSIEARYLEGLWRARLGDRTGAALAFGRLREAIDLSPSPKPAWAGWLAEAADNALQVEDDPVQAERLLASALRIAPNDREMAARYRSAAERVADRRRR